jgi:DNA modification methylase/predicted RNA-binding Zn-ribbon protein involved in translation (DUF1610 family)
VSKQLKLTETTEEERVDKNDKKKLTAADLDQVRRQEGFPLGRDEEIINLSDPPYYTACPNPFLLNFIDHYGKPFDAAADNYHREPFAADVSEGKNDPIYNAHSYHTKVPHRAIMRYILHYTEPGDLVFDGFCGTGMTGVAAQLCGSPDPELKLQVEQDMPGVKWGARRAVLGDLSPAATFIAYNYNNPVDIEEFEQEAQRILAEVEAELGWMYETRHVLDGKVQKSAGGEPVLGKINYTVWSDVFTCPECGAEMVFWEAAVDQEAGKVRKRFSCPSCGVVLEKRNLERAWETVFDHVLGKAIQRARQVPVLINYTVGRKRYEKEPDQWDLDLLQRIEGMEIPWWFPTDRMPEGDESRRNDKYGVTHVHHFYPRRNLAYLSMIHDKIKCNKLRLLMLWFTSSLIRTSKMYKFTLDRKMGTISGTLFIPSLFTENSARKLLERKILDISKIYLGQGIANNYLVSTNSSIDFCGIRNNSLDYIFTDPPFGSNLMYSELNFLWEAWLKVFTNNQTEAIVNSVQGKDLGDYQHLMERCLREMYRILKPGRWMTMVFHNSKNSVWNVIMEAITSAGFVIADIRLLDKKQGSFKQVTSTQAVKSDLVISAYKPRQDFLASFEEKSAKETGVWEFTRHHLKNLPVIVEKEGRLELVMERQKTTLYDRMVAFYVQKGIPVPISAPDYYAGLYRRFEEDDDMYFLPDQAVTYRQKKLEYGKPEQMHVFLNDERSARQWIWVKLKEKPMSYQELHPLFMQELRQARHEKLPELLDLLEENFLQNEEGKWYIPRPEKQSDMEKLREKALLKEFRLYLESGGKLRQFRSEAIRAGFKDAWGRRDYRTIVDTARRLPESFIQDDFGLLMYYRNALSQLEE